VLAADQVGDERYSPAAQATSSVTIAKVDQTIAFPGIEVFGVSHGSATFAVTASSGLAVSYDVRSGLCTITGHTLTASAPGLCVVAATQAGDSSYNAAPEVTASVTVGESDNGCGCHSTNHGASTLLILLVATGLRRRKRSRS
jgi:MYXO-CTERM domain-containing protein